MAPGKKSHFGFQNETKYQSGSGKDWFNEYECE